MPKAQYGKYFPAQIMKLYGGVDVRIRAYLRTKQGDWLASQPARSSSRLVILELFHRYRLTNEWAPRRYANESEDEIHFIRNAIFPYVLCIWR